MSYITCGHNTPQKWRTSDYNFGWLYLFEVLFEKLTRNNSLTQTDFRQGWICGIDFMFLADIPIFQISQFILVGSFPMSNKAYEMVLHSRLGVDAHFWEHAVDVLIQILVDNLLLLLDLLTIWGASFYFFLSLLGLSTVLVDADVCEIVHIFSEGGKTWEVCLKHISIWSIVFTAWRGTFVQLIGVGYFNFLFIWIVLNSRCLVEIFCLLVIFRITRRRIHIISFILIIFPRSQVSTYVFGIDILKVFRDFRALERLVEVYFLFSFSFFFRNQYGAHNIILLFPSDFRSIDWWLQILRRW